jgi:hypothetical protein
VTNRRGKRTAIPGDVAARVLFLSDRTCCVCRNQGKPVQIHHLDEDPSNHALQNLAVLCLDCHRETQLRGGFDRKLDAGQVSLYKDDWHRLVNTRRAQVEIAEFAQTGQQYDVELTTSLLEIYRDAGDFESLARLYEHIGNTELRDKYIEAAIAAGADDEWTILYRSYQKRTDLLPPDVIRRREEVLTEDKDWLQRARHYHCLSRNRDAVKDYLRGIAEVLEEGRPFTAAFYLKELCESNLTNELFIESLHEAREAGDLWWEIRALQELGWESELKSVVSRRKDEGGRLENIYMRQTIASISGDRETYKELAKRIAHQESEATKSDDSE